MGTKIGPKINTEGLIFCADPANPKSFNVSTNALTDIVGGKSMTLGANTTDVTTYGVRHFSSTAGESGTGALDTGYRYGTIVNGDKVIGGDTSFTIFVWIYKTTGNPNNWWHVITDGHSGDILTINQSGNMVISMNSSYGGQGASGTYNINWSSAKSNSWNLVGVRYDINTGKVDCFLGHLDNGVTFSAKIATSPINTAFKVRNFVGWGSTQSSYHSDPSHSHCIVYNTSLLDTEITENFNQMKARFI